MMHAGTMENAWIVLCGRCERESRDFTNYRNDAIERLKIAGWEKTELHGWLCPTCAKAVNVSVNTMTKEQS